MNKRILSMGALFAVCGGAPCLAQKAPSLQASNSLKVGNAMGLPRGQFVITPTPRRGAFTLLANEAPLFKVMAGLVRYSSSPLVLVISSEAKQKMEGRTVNSDGRRAFTVDEALELFARGEFNWKTVDKAQVPMMTTSSGANFLWLGVPGERCLIAPERKKESPLPYRVPARGRLYLLSPEAE
jgi:hypothetical protein